MARRHARHQSCQANALIEALVPTAQTTLTRAASRASHAPPIPEPVHCPFGDKAHFSLICVGDAYLQRDRSDRRQRIGQQHNSLLDCLTEYDPYPSRLFARSTRARVTIPSHLTFITPHPITQRYSRTRRIRRRISRPAESTPSRSSLNQSFPAAFRPGRSEAHSRCRRPSVGQPVVVLAGGPGHDDPSYVVEPFMGSNSDPHRR